MTQSVIHETAQVHQGASIGNGCTIWGMAEISGSAKIGENSTVGRGAYIGQQVMIGANCKIQDLAQVFGPAAVADGVFIGPGAILTNDKFPRAVNPDGTLKSPQDWALEGVEVGKGASIGAGAVCVAPVKIGSWALVAAGSIVTSDVKSYSNVRGVPARHVGWVGPAGFPLLQEGTHFRCPETGFFFAEMNDQLFAEET